MSRFVRVLSKILSILTMVAVVFMSLATTADAVSRNLGFGSLGLVHDLSVTALVAAAFLALAEVERTDENVNFRLIIDKVPATFRHWLGGFFYLLSTLGVGWVSYVTAMAAWESFQSTERMLGLAQLVTWPGRTIVAFGFMALFGVMLNRWLRRSFIPMGVAEAGTAASAEPDGGE